MCSLITRFSNLGRWLQGLLCFLLWVRLSVRLIVRRAVVKLVVACGNRSVVLRCAGGDMPEIDL